MLVGQIYHILISICDVNDLDQSPVLRFGPKLIRNRACSDVSQCPSTLYVPRRRPQHSRGCGVHRFVH